ncbi:MAG: hypothetical protein DLM67_07205 [Candidatus Nephthysia bennettiae]|uniref:Uncharacterized protein n=1 Tax=Candidatus Nephthysia bennettiae TaxID=3127016 RepID=A0A934NE08_9BACT|nr:hypothetical protein [Candidatus Dormibacteraeota bacterium]MBJ7614557.1 hypothetical protein [Candidatus Dormibacteraeota bacterium]PZR97675.1 MAG: hypothetical protein DLM67_07205 [Candidatus Dormibacteraeota bacterium]
MSWRAVLDPRTEVFREWMRMSLPGGGTPTPRSRKPELNAELKLAGPPYEPLQAHLIVGADPLQPFARTFERLSDELEERATICVDLRAVPNARARWIRQFWLGKARGNVVKGELAEPETTQGLPVGQVVTRRQDTSRLNDKLNPREVLFEVQILIHTESLDPARPVEIFRSFLTGFQQWKGANELTVHGQLVTLIGHDVRFFGADAFAWRRWWFWYRLRHGLFWPASPGLVTAWELAGLLKPWTVWNTSTAPVRGGPCRDAPAPRLRERARGG